MWRSSMLQRRRDAFCDTKSSTLGPCSTHTGVQQHASCIATAIEAAYGAEATTTIRAALDAENQRLHGRIVGLLQLSAVV